MEYKKYIVLVLLSIWGVCLSIQANDLPREVVNLNREWLYSRDNTAWQNIGLPHSFSIPYFMSKDFYTGLGWYKKTLTLSAEDMKKKLFLEFDGVFQEAEVAINGKIVGTHVGGYTGFSMDISSAVQVGNNIITVCVSNLWKPNVAPRAGEHIFSGGIYRNVRLVKKNPVHIDWYGVFITTPDLYGNRGKASAVKIETEICNHSSRTVEYKLLTQIVDSEGKVITSVESSEKAVANGANKMIQQTKPLNNPHLWHPGHPYLYKVVSSLYQGTKLVDRTETAFGFRWFKWTADKGFFLNGKHLFFKGVNVHQDQAGWGDAVTESAMRRDVRMMKKAGFDLIRGSHYPHAPAFSQACDEEGMLFWSEAPFWGIGGFKPDGYWDCSAYPVNTKDIDGFEANALQQLEEMIRIHRNHPSIIAWSMCNEAFFSAPEAMDGVRRLLKKMVDLSHQLDPSRPAAIGGAQRPLGDARIDKIGDIAGYNGDGATQPDFQNPGIPNIVSEYGSVTSERPGKYAPGWGDLQRDNGWKGFSWRSGQAIWCGFDHGSIAGSNLGKMGIVDYFRIPKRSWYWYRNEYTQITPPEWPEEGVPAQLKLEASGTTGILTDGTDDVQLLVTILNADGKPISNSPTVELKIISGPGEFPTGTSICFAPDSDIRIMDGQAAIAFRSYHAGTAVIEATSPGLKAARIEITFEGNDIWKEGITPRVKERPYTRYTREKQEKSIQTFGRNNPTFASSYHEGQAVGLAADGNPVTFWQAAEKDTAPYWILDTEKSLTLHEIQIVFPSSTVYCYTVDISDDKQQWLTVSDKQNTTKSEQQVLLSFKKGSVNARFVRIRFSEKSSAAISEVIVKGIVRE